MGNFKPKMVINYQKGDVDSYESVTITYDFNKRTKIFDSGNFVRDWYYATKFKIQLDKLDFDFSMEESKVYEGFLNDGAPYDKLWLKRGENGLPELTDNSSYCWPKKSMFFVERDTSPTWEGLRRICEDN